MDSWHSAEGSSSHLGVTWIEEEQAFNFALYSKHAAEVTLLLYSKSDLVHPLHEYRFNPLINKSGRVWHCRAHWVRRPCRRNSGRRESRQP